MSIISEVLADKRQEKMIALDIQLKQEVAAASPGELIICPICRYVGKNKRGTCKVFDNGTMKCFSCGVWRRFS